MRIRLPAARFLTPLLLASLCAFVGAAVPAQGEIASQPLTGSIALKPLRTTACKSYTTKVRAKPATVITCRDSGLFQGRPRQNSGAGYAWYWVSRKGDPVREVGELSVNFGNGIVFLHLTGVLRTIGTATATLGRARTSGTFRSKRATGAYKGRSISGRYSLTLERNAKTYRVLALRLDGAIA